MKPYYKVYKDYSEYVEHQKSKLNKERSRISEFDKQYFLILKERLLDDFVKQDMKKGNVLCLGARLGGEVKAFIELDRFAVGIDLNPGEDNKFVLQGDFHKIQFPSNSIDIVFTNSLDHVFNLDEALNEIKRVLKPDGYFITEIVDYNIGDKYESFFWEKSDDILDILINSGFKLIKRTSFTSPWKGEHCIFKK